MSIDIVMIKRGGVLVPATEHDQHKVDSLKEGEAVNVKVTTKKKRHYKHHCRYWALIRFALDYWQPKGGLITVYEKQFAVGLVSFVKSMGLDSGGVKELLRQYMKSLINDRKEKVTTPEKSAEALSKWVKVEAGHYDAVLTPDGVIKYDKSISFDEMDEIQYRAFYDDAYSVLWNSVLSSKFNSRKEFEQALNKLSKFGNDR